MDNALDDRPAPTAAGPFHDAIVAQAKIGWLAMVRGYFYLLDPSRGNTRAGKETQTTKPKMAIKSDPSPVESYDPTLAALQ